MLGFAGENALNGWVKHPHPAKPGYHAARGLHEVRRVAVPPSLAGVALLGAAPAAAGAAKPKTVTVGDNYFTRRRS